MADVTNKETRVPGVNQDTNYIRQEAHIIDAAGLGVTAVGTHELFVVPQGGMLTNFRVAMLGAGSGSANANVKFQATVNGSAVELTSGAAMAAYGSGACINIPVNGAVRDLVGSGAVIQMVVASAALIDFKALVIAESIPVEDYLTLG